MPRRRGPADGYYEDRCQAYDCEDGEADSVDPNLSAMLCEAEEEGYDAGFGEVEREGKSDDRRDGGLWCYQRGFPRSKSSSERFDAYLDEGTHIMPGVDVLPRFTCTVI